MNVNVKRKTTTSSRADVNCETIDFSLPDHAAESLKCLLRCEVGLIDIYYKQL